jgi:hypothetical protein
LVLERHCGTECKPGSGGFRVLNGVRVPCFVFREQGIVIFSDDRGAGRFERQRDTRYARRALRESDGFDGFRNPGCPSRTRATLG